MLPFGLQIRRWAGITAVALIAGCAIPRPTEAPHEAAPAPLPKIPVSAADGAWEMTASTFIGTGRIPGVPRATLAFEEGRISAYSGCNRASGNAYHADGRLEVSALSATRRACAEPLNTFEARYFGLLRAKPVYRVEGDTLMLLDEKHNARFRRMVQGPGGTAGKP
ncbi:MAG TPA: META domain-containing protein [Burkholderiales bacterium]|nr:META domain-containing protein [Burkholderiales bacterium]